MLRVIVLLISILRASGPMQFTATAYCTPGHTVKGNHTHLGTAAADPAIIPLGSKVRVTGAGEFSGEYVVTDTGPRVGPRIIDLYIPDAAAAKAFGRKPVQVEILTLGDNVKNRPQTTPKVPPSKVAPGVKAVAGETTGEPTSKSQ